MTERRSFRGRVRLALVLCAVVPALTMLGLGAYAAQRALALGEAAGAWERVAGSGAELIRAAEASGDPTLTGAAAAHREELTASVTHARRWEYVMGRAVSLVPLAGLALAALLAVAAVVVSRRLGRRLSEPVEELVGWAGRIVRREPLPVEARAGGGDEFAVLRDAFRRMATELDASRARELEAERTRAWVAMARNVAHELKNPLTPMRLALHTLERQAPEGAAAREALDVLSAESARLEEMARSFAQLGSPPEGPPSPVDLREMLEYLVRTHLPPEAAGAVDIPPDLPLVCGHHDALSRAFANLLLNAGEAVAGRAGGRVHVAAREVGASVEVCVRDDGPGIEAEHLEHIWAPDFTTRARGTGLGLALVRQAVLAHGGRVEAHNRPEGGAEFVVRVPAAAEVGALTRLA